MNQSQAIGIVAALMVLIIMVSGLMRRQMPMKDGVRLALIWVAIIAGATVIAIAGQRLMR